jgi:hypothetical protein
MTLTLRPSTRSRHAVALVGQGTLQLENATRRVVDSTLDVPEQPRIASVMIPAS